MIGLEEDDGPEGDNVEQDEDNEENVVDETEPPEENARLVIAAHEEAVLSVCVSGSGNVAVSGGKDDRAVVWNTSNGDVSFVCEGHKDSVIAVKLSAKETYLATADMGGLIQAWKLETTEKFFEYEVGDLQWLEWHPILDTVLFCGTDSGNAWMLKVNDDTQVKTFQGSGSANTVGKITSCGTKAAMGYDDGAVRIWDLKSGAVIHSFKGIKFASNLALSVANLFLTLIVVLDKWAHKGSVSCLDIQSDDALLASGAVDGTVKIINFNSGKVIQTLDCGKKTGNSGNSSAEQGQEDDDSVESIAFCKSMPILATATVKGVIEVWDISTLVRRFVVSVPDGISKIAWDLADPVRLHSAGLDGALRTWDGRTGQSLAVRYGHRHHILDMALARSRAIAVTASEDATCRIFDLS